MATDGALGTTEQGDGCPPCVPPPKSQHVLPNTGQSRDGDVGLGMSLGQGTQLCLAPCLSFPPKTRGRGPRPLLRTGFLGVHLEQEEFWRESKRPSTKPAS